MIKVSISLVQVADYGWIYNSEKIKNMIKYIIILIFLLSACTTQLASPEIVSLSLSGEETQVPNINTSMILANMDINEESIFTGGVWVSGNPKYTGGYNLLNWVESRCVGSDFEEFRVCLIEWLLEVRDEFDKVTNRWRDIDTYIDTIRRELTYMDHYKVLDNQPMPLEYYKGSLWDEDQLAKSCYSVMTGSVSYSGWSYYPDVVNTIPIVLWFQNTAYDELVSIFPSWSDAREIPLSREEYHCGWVTFWPGYGTIFYVLEESDTVYLFIKDADGGGSGDFSYSIFAYKKNTHKFIHLWSFHAYSGIIPLPLIRNDENGEPISSSRSMILSTYRNRTFLYTSYIYIPMNNITKGILNLLEKSIQ